MNINKKFWRFLIKEKYKLLIIFFLLNLIATVISSFQFKSIYQAEYDLNYFLKTNNLLTHSTIRLPNTVGLIEEFIVNLNENNLSDSNFVKKNGSLITNGKLNYRIFFGNKNSNKAVLFIQIFSKTKNIKQFKEFKEFKDKLDYFDKFFKSYLKKKMDIRENLVNLSEKQRNDYSNNFNIHEKIHSKFLNYEFNKLKYENNKQFVKYTYIKNTYGIFNSIFILFIFILYFRKR